MVEEKARDKTLSDEGRFVRLCAIVDSGLLFAVLCASKHLALFMALIGLCCCQWLYVDGRFPFGFSTQESRLKYLLLLPVCAALSYVGTLEFGWNPISPPFLVFAIFCVVGISYLIRYRVLRGPLLGPTHNAAGKRISFFLRLDRHAQAKLASMIFPRGRKP